MSRRLALQFLIIILIGILAGCSSLREPISPEKREAYLLLRADRFFNLVENKQYELAYAMFHESVREETEVETYVAKMKAFFENVSVSHLPPEIVSIDGDIGLTRTVLTVKTEQLYAKTCVLLEWKWGHDNSWYLFDNQGTCNVLR